MFSLHKKSHTHNGRIINQWTFDAKSPLLSSAVAIDIDGDGKKEIIFGTKDGRVFCIDEEARPKWEYDIREEIGETESFFYDEETVESVHATPTIKDVNDDGKVEIIFGTELGLVYCLDNKGKFLWKHKVDGAVRSRILIEDLDGDGVMEVMFGTINGTFYILSATGKERSLFELNESIQSEPAIFKGKETSLLFGTEKGSFFCYDALGEQRWSFKTKGAIRSKPVFGKLMHEENLVISDLSGVVYCLDLEGNEEWSFKTGGAIYGRATLADLNNDGSLEVVVGSCDNRVYCISNKGEKIWSYETDFWIVSPPIVTDIDGDGSLEVVVGSYDHNLYILDGKGAYTLDYIPGLSGVAHQAGHYTEILTQEPGEHVGKRLWQIKTQGMIVGCEEIEKDNIIVNVKSGQVDAVRHSK